MNREILRLAIPNILSNITVPMMGVVDTALMGHLPDAHYLVSLGVGVAVFNFVYWGFGFLRMGSTGFAAQAYGARDAKQLSLVLFRAGLLGLFIALLLLLLQSPLWELGRLIIRPDALSAEHARQYFHIRILAAPANMLLLAITGWFLGLQNAFYALLIAVFSNAVNIGLSIFFVHYAGMAIDGVAWGTVIAQYSGLLLALFLLIFRYRSYLPLPQLKELLHWQELRQFFSVNGNIFIRTLALIFVFTWFTAQSSRLGSDILAVNTIFLQMLAVVSYGLDGFAFAAESLTGKYIGRGDRPALQRMIARLFVWGFALSALLSLAYLLFNESILRFFTSHEKIIRLAQSFGIWIILAPLVNNFAYLWDGIYIGATAGRSMRNSMLIAAFAVFVPLDLFLQPLWGNHGLWLAFTLFMIARGLYLWKGYRKNIPGFQS